MQKFNTKPLNGADNLGAINCSVKVAINSSTLNFMVNILSGSSGWKFDSIPLLRKEYERVVLNSSMVLPVDIYILSLRSSGFQDTNLIVIVNISRSKYSASTTTTTTAAAVSTSTPSPTSTSTAVTLSELGECFHTC